MSRALRFGLCAAILMLAAGPARAGDGSRPTSWETVQKLVLQSHLIAVVKVRAIDVDEHTMTLDVKKILFAEKRAPRRLVLTYFAGDDLEDRVPVGSVALAFLVSSKKRWTPAYVDGFGVWSVQDDEVVEWIEGKPQGYFYTLGEITRRIGKWARKRSER